MTGSPATLPEQFRDLEKFAAIWGPLQSQQQRYLLRDRSALADLREFYDAVAPRLDEIFGYLDRFPRDNLPPAERLLFQTVLGVAEVGQGIESFGEARLPFSPEKHDVTLVWQDLTPSKTPA